MFVRAGCRIGVVAAVCIAVIHLYRWLLSPFLGGQCRFYPTCSSYALQALRSQGALRGGWLILRRLTRCHPWHPGGVDFVPGTSSGGVSFHMQSIQKQRHE